MIVVERKNINDILENLKGFKKILLVGCNGCVGIYQLGGEKQAIELAMLINMGNKLKDKKIDTKAITVIRQCDKQIVKEELGPIITDCDIILSLACGAGVQTVAEVFENIPVIPANDTKFIGAQAREKGTLFEMCIACGNCILDKTGGICPVTRCPKSHLNGPCGGVYKGKCETDKERDCAWLLIYNKLKLSGKLESMKKIASPKDFTKAAHPRKQEV
ncbi:MAG: methylenetetrahydrofolate reductase C-terminal domain-containing protein [Euryarchaeota archaeon]|nr:methylenetetrahydrofolate reductase C-terminal domain-containing protein [Euryarchaeota archaeon]